MNKIINRNKTSKSKITLYGGDLFLFTFLTFIMISFSCYAQQPAVDFKTIDKVTYKLLLNNEWNSLIETGKMALKNKHDYFYLRMRLGIAYYETENYRKAAQHFEKALEFNASDATAMEYLYYSYVLSNRKEEARALSSKFTASLENKLHTGKINFFEKLYIETGPTFSNNIEKNKINRFFGSHELFYREQDLNDDKYYAHLGFGINLSKRISVYLGYSFLTISKLKQIHVPEILLPGHNTNALYGNDYNLFQNEFYGNLKFIISKGFILTPAYHLLNVKYNTIYPVISFSPSTTYDIIENDTSFTDQVISLSLNKNISIFNIGITTSWSDLNNKYQYQLGGTFTWFPAGNLNFYTTSTLVSAWEEKKNRIVFDQLVGGRLSEKLWVEGTITFGEMINFNEKNAFVVHNSGDIIKFRTSVNFIVLLSDKTELSIRYVFLQEQGYMFSDSVEGRTKISDLNYQNNTIIGGLKWTF